MFSDLHLNCVSFLMQISGLRFCALLPTNFNLHSYDTLSVSLLQTLINEIVSVCWDEPICFYFLFPAILFILPILFLKFYLKNWLHQVACNVLIFY